MSAEKQDALFARSQNIDSEGSDGVVKGRLNLVGGQGWSVMDKTENDVSVGRKRQRKLFIDLYRPVLPNDSMRPQASSKIASSLAKQKRAKFSPAAS